MAQGQPDDAWTYVTQSLELAVQTASRKHLLAGVFDLGLWMGWSAGSPQTLTLPRRPALKG